MKRLLRNIPLVGQIANRAIKCVLGTPPGQQFSTSTDYWETRYRLGGDSGKGSYHQLAEFKAEVLNAFVARQEVRSVIEFGCGDGNQLRMAAYPRYIGYDVSSTAIEKCREAFSGDCSKRFDVLRNYAGEQAELSLSLDVIYHLVEDSIFERHMQTVFGAATRFVAIYASNFESSPGSTAPHVRHRRFTNWIEEHRPEWSLLQHVPARYPYDEATGEGSLADFFIFGRTTSSGQPNT